ncbi:MAG: inositol 2-dehydrogenase [Anaerolineae bacterium]|jgi:myo-inositol 2-dehydrogenase/D-chiro-inositol 1-dehydrogenase
MTRQINVGIIGAGRIGRVHAENLAYRIPEANVVAIADIFVESAEKCAADFNIPSAFKDHQAIMEDDEIEAVVICSSTDTHAQFIGEAAAAGKHIFCEKPIDFDLKRIDQALEAVSQAGVKLQIGFNRRFDPSFKHVRDAVAEGKIGTPHILHIFSRDPAPPPIEYIQVSGGIFLDMTIHDFDMARYLIGSEVEEVYAIGGVMIDPRIGQAGDIDTALVTLRYAQGAIGSIDNSRQAVYGYDQRVEVFGSEGSMVVANHTPDNAIYSNAAGVHAAKPLYFFIERYTDAYIAEMREFITCILEDTMPSVTGIDGRIPVVMGLAAWKSYHENRPVKLSEID